MFQQERQTSSWLNTNHPLIIASSGGNGHISAALSLIQQLSQQQKTLKHHYISKPKNKKLSIETLIWGGLYFFNIPLIKKLSRLEKKYYIPSPFQLKKEKMLLLKQQEEHHQRPYIDYLLDLLPNGYLYTAIFNLLQSQGHGKSLNTVSKGQVFLDRFYKKPISQQLQKLLEQAIIDGNPFDSIISTQALGLPAICHAVNVYNQKIPQLEKKHQKNLLPIQIHQFITDIPKASALHYLKPLQSIKAQEKNYLSIHLLKLDEQSIFAEQNLAKHFYFYAPEQNPMIRTELRKKNYFHDFWGFNILWINHKMIACQPKEKIAVLMLSSAQGQTTLDYLKALIQKNIEHIAIVGKTCRRIQKQIHELQQQSPSKIYLLGHLNAKNLRKILNAAHLLIIKGGGLSLMELASFKLRPDCKILIHHPKINLGADSSQGLIWEDGNIQWFLEYCKNNQKNALLSNPLMIDHHLSEL